MPRMSIHLAVWGKPLKVFKGPMTSPIPVPTFDMDVIAPDTDVMKSRPVKDSAAEINTNPMAYTKKKLMTEVGISRGIGFPA